MCGEPTVYRGTSVPASSYIQYLWKAIQLCNLVDNTQKVCSKELTYLVQQQHSCSQKNMFLPYTPTMVSSNNMNCNSKSHNFQLSNSTRIKHHYLRQYHPNNIRTQFTGTLQLTHQPCRPTTFHTLNQHMVTCHRKTCNFQYRHLEATA